jgi:hypothetical protein
MRNVTVWNLYLNFLADLTYVQRLAHLYRKNVIGALRKVKTVQHSSKIQVTLHVQVLKVQVCQIDQNRLLE